jgi:hypothetical protein
VVPPRQTALSHACVVQDISIVTSRAPEVHRPAGAQNVYLTFQGLRDSRTIADKLTRVRVSLPVSEARRLSEQLAALNDQVDR